jgi:hypothetical protein
MGEVFSSRTRNDQMEERKMSDQYKVALFRGVILGILTGASTALATWATTSDPNLEISAGLLRSRQEGWEQVLL